MKFAELFSALVLIMAALALSACATPKAAEPKPKWEMATAAEVDAALDLAVKKAAKDMVQLKKDGVLLFCKKYRQIGSNIPTITCLTEAELRIRVQNMDKYRDDMRQRTGRCVLGSGCRSDGGPNAAGN